MQIRFTVTPAWRPPEITLKLFKRTIHIDARIFGVVTLPHRNRSTPIAVARNRPVTSISKPVTKNTIFNMLWLPRNLLIKLHHAIPKCRDLHEPRGHRLIDQRIAAAPAVWIAVHIALFLHEHSAVFSINTGKRPCSISQIVNNWTISFKHLHMRVITHSREKFRSSINRFNDLNTSIGKHEHIVFTIRCNMHKPRTIFCGHVVCHADLPSISARSCSVTAVVLINRVEHLTVQVTPFETAQHLRLFTQFFHIGSEASFTNHHDFTSNRRALHIISDFYGNVIDIGSDSHSQVRRKRPGRCRPNKNQFGLSRWRFFAEQRFFQTHTYCDSLVLTILINIVIHFKLMVGQRCLIVPAIREHAVPFVDKPFIVECLEAPDY